VLARCSTQPAPWFIVPADRKWYRNAVVARIVRSTLEALDLTYPAEIPGLDKVQIERGERAVRRAPGPDRSGSVRTDLAQISI
jgi:hypothetical protein